MALSHLKLSGYEEVGLPYDLFCPSVQKKLAEKDGSRYQCEFVKCKKIFATLELVKLHLKITGHKKLAMKATRKDEMTEEEDNTELYSERAPLVDIANFLKHPFEEIDHLDDK